MFKVDKGTGETNINIIILRISTGAGKGDSPFEIIMEAEPPHSFDKEIVDK